jgi:hypothetical protein
MENMEILKMKISRSAKESQKRIAPSLCLEYNKDTLGLSLRRDIVVSIDMAVSFCYNHISA